MYNYYRYVFILFLGRILHFTVGSTYYTLSATAHVHVHAFKYVTIKQPNLYDVKCIHLKQTSL